MTNSERLLKTLNFETMTNGGAILETFYPWNLSINRWRGEGLPEKYNSDQLYKAYFEIITPEQSYLDTRMAVIGHDYNVTFHEADPRVTAMLTP